MKYSIDVRTDSKSEPIFNVIVGSPDEQSTHTEFGCISGANDSTMGTKSCEVDKHDRMMSQSANPLRS